MQVFDPKQEYSVVWRRLPHWSQAGTMAFITWRTWDSMPRAVIDVWLAERHEWLARHGVKCTPHAEREDEHLAERDAYTSLLGPALAREFQLFLSDRWNDHLDDLHGACVLRRPELADEVVKSLHRFDGNRYELSDFVIMPNHVHVLAAFPDEKSMLQQCDSWKHFTATKINRALGRSGRFWQQDGFDHLVRSPDQFEYLRRYCADNPKRSRLSVGEFLHYSKPV